MAEVIIRGCDPKCLMCTRVRSKAPSNNRFVTTYQSNFSELRHDTKCNNCSPHTVRAECHHVPPHPSPFPRAASASINKISTSRTLAASLGCCRPCFVCGSRPECQYHTRCRACLLGPSENGIQRWPNLILNFHPQRLLGGLYPGTASEEQC